MDKVRIAVIGVGGMGTPHARDCKKILNADLIGVCDIDKQKADTLAKELGVKAYYDFAKLMDEAKPDAVLIATPHYFHTPIAIEAFRRGIHVLSEKPVGVHVNDIQRMIDAHKKARKKNPKLVFAAMFMMRTYGFWKKIKEMIDQGQLGRLLRTTWIITDWFRPQFYYDSGGWRATWKGEGGGVLLNQCPHNLDLYQWFVGVPDRITGFAKFGKYHHIEVEDEVTAFFEYKNGMVGHFITTTGELPGSNRLEIDGENGKLVFEDGKLYFFKNKIPVFKFIKEAREQFPRIEFEKQEIPYEHHGQGGHAILTQNFINAILKDEELIAQGSDGLNSVMISNAVLLSTLKGNKPIDIPLNGDEVEKQLKKLISSSKFKKS